MTKAEKALREGNTSACIQAVYVLDRWTAEQREQFRTAFLCEDWRTVHILTMQGAHRDMAPSRMTLNHLMDATAPES